MPRVEVMPPDELPVNVPARADDESPHDRGEHGRFARGDGIARRGGHARAGQTRLADRMGLATLAGDAAFAPYRRAAVSFRRAQCAELARTVGGGICGPSSGETCTCMRVGAVEDEDGDPKAVTLDCTPDEAAREASIARALSRREVTHEDAAERVRALRLDSRTEEHHMLKSSPVTADEEIEDACAYIVAREVWRESSRRVPSAPPESSAASTRSCRRCRGLASTPARSTCAGREAVEADVLAARRRRRDRGCCRDEEELATSIAPVVALAIWSARKLHRARTIEIGRFGSDR
ncbi:MAG: hypothetical protein KIT84_24390 [Labilithrix sp.]|nr:hypothetical protein [Labilithrix sp.]MCW5814188.1 hypothetical protein [Labilithrix sp.]